MAVTAAQVRSYLVKVEEYLAAAVSELDAGRPVAATSLAIHAAINAADAVTGQRTGHRAAGQDHDEVRPLLRGAGKDGAELEKDLARLLALKTKAEYEPTCCRSPRRDARSSAPAAAWQSLGAWLLRGSSRERPLSREQ